MEFRLTYEGPLYAYNVRRDEELSPPRAKHIHDIRRVFHRQLKALWNTHPLLVAYKREGHDKDFQINANGFNWQILAPKSLGLICRLEVLMLRTGPAGGVLADIDNRLKTLFDALRWADNPNELAGATPQPDEDPFCVLLHDDRLITHLAVTTDLLLEPVITSPPTPAGDAVRLMLGVTLRPYKVGIGNLDFT